MYDLLKERFHKNAMFDSGQIDQVLACFHPINTKKGEVLLSKGATPKHLYFVNKGYIRVFCIRDDGQEFTRFLAFEGEFGTSFPGFVAQGPSLAFIDTLEPSELLALHYRDFQQLLQYVPAFERMYRFLLEKSYAESILRIEKLITMQAKERYVQILENEPHLVQRLPNSVLANYMGISQETLSRLKRQV